MSGSDDQTVRIWDMDTGACKILAIIEPESISAGVNSVAVSPDGRWVAAGSYHNLVRIWDASTGALVERLRGHTSSVSSVAFTPDGRGLVSGSWDHSVKYWDIIPMVRAVAAGAQAGGASQVLLRQDRSVASNARPVPGGKEGGGGETGSVCSVTFTGHEVRLALAIWGLLSCCLADFDRYLLTCRKFLRLLLSRLMGSGLYLARGTAAFGSGSLRMVKVS